MSKNINTLVPLRKSGKSPEPGYRIFLEFIRFLAIFFTNILNDQVQFQNEVRFLIRVYLYQMSNSFCFERLTQN